MNIDVIEQEYLDAVSEVYKIVDEISSNPHISFSPQDAAIKRFIAAIYDPVIPCNVLEMLMCSDQRLSNTLLVLLVGRCKYGRPRHERADDMLAWGHQCLRASAMTDFGA